MITLKHVMAANAASCIVFGILFTFAPSLVAGFLGGTEPAPSIYILGLGIVLVVNGLHIVWAISQTPIKRLWVYYFTLGDYLWVIASIVLLALNIFISTSNGIMATLVIAAMVGTFGTLQLLLLFKQGESPQENQFQQ